MGNLSKRNSLKILILVFTAGIALSSVFIILNGNNRLILTDEERQWLHEHDNIITIGCDPDYPPIDYIDKNRFHRGVAEDFLRVIENRLDFRFKRINPSSWADMLEMLKLGKLDAIKCAVATPERKQYLNFTESFIDVPTVIIVNIENQKKLTLDDIKGKQVAVTRNYWVHEYIRNNHPGIKVVGVNNDGEALSMVASGEIAYAISDLPTALHFIKSKKITHLRISGETGIVYKLGIGIIKKWEPLHSILAKAVKSVSLEERNRIIKKWIDIEYDTYLYGSNLWYILLATLGMILITAILLFLWIATLRVAVKRKTSELENYRDTLEVMVEDRTRSLVEANTRLSDALAKVNTLSGMLPICSNCKKIRDDKGYWNGIEDYLKEHSMIEFSHSLCPDCLKKLYPEFYNNKHKKEEDK